LIRELVSYHPVLFTISMAGAAVFAVCTVASSWALRWVIDEAILPRFEEASSDQRNVVVGVAILVAIALTRAGGVIIRRTWAGKTQWRTAESMTGEVVDRLVRQPASWHRRQRTGDLITRAGVDVEAAVAVLAPLPYASSVFLMMIVAAIGLIVLDGLLGVLAVAVFPLLIIANVQYQRRVDTWFALAQAELGSLSSATHESFEAITVVKAFGAERAETDRLAEIAGRVRAARVRAISLRSTFETLLDILPNITNVVMILVGVHRVNAGHLSVGGLASFIYLFALLVFPLRLVGYALSELPRSQAGRGRIRSFMDQPILGDPRAGIIDSSIKNVAGSTLSGNVCVSMSAVTARHIEPEDEPVVETPLTESSMPVDEDHETADLQGIDLEVSWGSTVAIVGPTGCGKTTLLEVIAGVLPIVSGRIMAPTASMAVVFQEPFLLGATIADNVLMGRDADSDAVQWALRTAEASFVEELPNGIETIVGERGVSLSGGQRQRVALARAILGRPRLLLLDDTTSALDPVTERKVIENLRRVLPDTTLISVASRPSLIRIADSVVYMESGRIVAQGHHERLLASSEKYRELISAFEKDRSDNVD
jgi:ABC-type multidrug transport system fused ATPase/permease subunit